MSAITITREQATVDFPNAHDQIHAANALMKAGHAILDYLERGIKLDTRDLRSIMTDNFGGSDVMGAWDFKLAYEACEIAQILFLRKYGRALLRRCNDSARFLAQIHKIQALLPPQTHRSETSVDLQQFSTPLDLGLAVGLAAQMTDNDVVLEPSSGTGMLAIYAELTGSHLYLNEYADLRKSLLERLFLQSEVTGFDAGQLDDRLPPHIRPTIVIMNPPFSHILHVQRKMPDTIFKHVNAALTRLVEGGRLVTITGSCFAPSGSREDEWRILSDKASLVLSVSLSGKIYARHGTTVPTRLSVFDKMVGLGDPIIAEADNVEGLLGILSSSLPCR